MEYYEKAVAINPHDILAVLGIAETTAALEFTFSDLFPDKAKHYNAFPFYKRVRIVEPNGVASNYSAARYFHQKRMKKELFAQVQHTAKYILHWENLKKSHFILLKQAGFKKRI